MVQVSRVYEKKTNQEALTSCIYKLSMIICIHWKTFLIVMCQTTSNLSQNFMEFFSEWKRAKYCQLDTKNCQRDFWGTYSCASIVDVWFSYLLIIYSFQGNVLVPSQFIFLEISALNWRFQVYFIKNISLRISKSQGHRVSLSKKKKMQVITCFCYF